MKKTILILSALALTAIRGSAGSPSFLASAQAAAVCPAVLPAGNAVSNSGFDTSIAGWQTQAGKWSPQDADGCASSGSITFTTKDNNAAASNCFSVSPGVYTLSMRVIQPPSAIFLGVCQVFYFTDNNCTQFSDPSHVLSYEDIIFAGQSPSWQTVQKIVTLPAAIHSAQLGCGPAGPGGTGNYYFDQLYFTKN